MTKSGTSNCSCMIMLGECLMAKCHHTCLHCSISPLWSGGFGGSSTETRPSPAASPSVVALTALSLDPFRFQGNRHPSSCHACASGNSSHSNPASFARRRIFRVRKSQTACDKKILASIVALRDISARNKASRYQGTHQAAYMTPPRISNVTCAAEKST